jgi:methyl-accepting chemotaxis protein
MFPDATGDLWYGNAACEHAFARLAAWLPPGFDPSNGIPGTIFFPEAEERRGLFSGREALPLKKRLRFGPETVSLLVSAVCDDDQQMLCPQITWEIVHSIAPAASTRPAVPVGATPARPVSGAPRSLPELGAAIRQEARALETGALALQHLSELLDALADQAVAGPSGTPGASLAGLGEESDAAARLAAQGLAALEAAREVAAGEGRSDAVGVALDRLMAVARHTNQLVVDASLHALEDSVGGEVNELLGTVAALRAGMASGAEALAVRTQALAQQLAGAVSHAGRLTELRESLRGPVAAAAPAAVEAVPA